MPLSPRLGHGLEDRGTEGHPSGSNIPIPFPLCLLFHHHVPCPQHRPPTGIWQGSGERTSLLLLVPHFGFKQVPQLPAGPGAMKSTHRVWGSLGRRSSGHPRAPVIHATATAWEGQQLTAGWPKDPPTQAPSPSPKRSTPQGLWTRRCHRPQDTQITEMQRGTQPSEWQHRRAADLKTPRSRKCQGGPDPVSGGVEGKPPARSY